MYYVLDDVLDLGWDFGLDVFGGFEVRILREIIGL